ncbi:diaminopimelate epimerase [Sphingomonas sp. SUN039]|uniref:diaminopimelate epimerase n=1 Tax=Sphingomonas sp. SUN039 TaxID=2937787 RepID=UPI00216402BB|nr:diaminopimelate epimerase [Sphingomonas sp. SUN039]UVO53824.1 diaminopimelate epimerase [Sphingomonas sp. SUN039]
MTGRFHKMHGLGNDFVVIDARVDAVAMTVSRARAIADRCTGIGCDQLIMVEPSDSADATMRIWNHDGSEVEACGNAMRALAVLIGKATLATKGGNVQIAPDDSGATVEIGAPRFGWQDIPLAYAMDTAAMPVGWEQLESPMAVNVGNPHVVFFVEDLDAVDVERLGPQIETDALFPQRINVNIAQMVDAGHIQLRTWERGAGLTLACGTGACATAVAAIRSRKATGPVEVAMTGGTLTIDWRDGEPIRMTGPATHVFTGEADWSRFGA